MTSSIHSSSVIADGAVIGNGVKVGPFCVVGSNVVLGDNVELKSHVVVEGHTKIGEGTVIYPFASIGHAPQDLKYDNEKTYLEIGSNNTIREHVTMNPGTVTGKSITRVGNNCLFMMGAHIAHDCIVGNNVILANNATLAGHVQVGDGAILGGLSAVHQFIRIGENAIIGGMSGVESNVIPFGRVKGERASLAGLNLIGLERRGVSKSELKELQKAFNLLFASEGTLDERIAAVRDTYTGNQNVQMIVDFAIEQSRFPLCQPSKKK